MHIPDGYLSPETAVVLYAAAAPFWWRASRKIKTLLSGRSVPLLALFSAFSFLVMMLNVPVPGGTTAHAVGTVVAAIVLGPWAALLTTTIALIIQAFFFGDGGILNIGANCFNMGIAMAFVGYYLYRGLAGNAPPLSPRRIAAGAIAGYVAINVAALLAGIELGLQAQLFHDAAGHPLYFPYPLSIAIPALLIPHLTLAGLAEALVTGLVIAWLQRSNPELLEPSEDGGANTARGLRWGWIALVGMVLIAPLGLLAPGTAWGEWSRDQLAQLGLSSIPAGFDRFAGAWSAPLSGYNIPVLNNPTLTYLISAFVGVALIVGLLFLLAWIFDRISNRNHPPVTQVKS